MKRNKLITIIATVMVATTIVTGGLSATQKVTTASAEEITRTGITVTEDNLGDYVDYSIRSDGRLDIKGFRNLGTETTISLIGASDKGLNFCTGCLDANSKVETIVIDSNLSNSISASAFAGCTSLKTITDRGVCNLSGDVFFETPVFKSIGNSAFSGCTSFESITKRNNDISYSDTNSFQNCTIGDYAFKGCSKLKSVSLGTGIDYGIGIFQDSGITEVSANVSAYYLTDKIPKDCFKNCINLSTVNLAGAKTIAEGAFSGCSSLWASIPSSVESIGDNAFNGCADIANLGSVNTISNTAFTNLKNNTIYYYDKDMVLPSTEGVKFILMNPEYNGFDIRPSGSSSDTLFAYGYYGKSKDAILPNIQGCNIRYAVNDGYMESLTIPSQVVDMAYSEFDSSTLKSIHFSERDSLLDSKLHFNCPNLVDFTTASQDKVTLNEGTIRNSNKLGDVDLRGFLLSYDAGIINYSSIKSLTIGECAIPKESVANCQIGTLKASSSKINNDVTTSFGSCSIQALELSNALNTGVPLACLNVNDLYLYSTMNSGELPVNCDNLILKASDISGSGFNYTIKSDRLKTLTIYNASGNMSINKDLVKNCPNLKTIICDTPVNLTPPNETVTYNDKNLCAVFKGTNTDYVCYYNSTDKVQQPDGASLVTTDDSKVFGGWSALDLTKKYQEVLPIIKDKPIESVVHTISYKVGGNVVSTQSLKEGEALSFPSVTTQRGQVFSGWDTTDIVAPNEDKTYTANITTLPSKSLQYVKDGVVIFNDLMYDGEKEDAINSPIKYIESQAGFEGWDKVEDSATCIRYVAKFKVVTQVPEGQVIIPGSTQTPVNDPVQNPSNSNPVPAGDSVGLLSILGMVQGCIGLKFKKKH